MSTSVYEFRIDDVETLQWFDEEESIRCQRTAAENYFMADVYREMKGANPEWWHRKMYLQSANSRAARLRRGDDWRAEWAECAIGETKHGYPIIARDERYSDGAMIIAALPPDSVSRFVAWFMDEDGNTFSGDYCNNLTDALRAYRYRIY